MVFLSLCCQPFSFQSPHMVVHPANLARDVKFSSRRPQYLSPWSRSHLDALRRALPEYGWAVPDIKDKKPAWV
jgi:hypothetical protein